MIIKDFARAIKTFMNADMVKRRHGETIIVLFSLIKRFSPLHLSRDVFDH